MRTAQKEAKLVAQENLRKAREETVVKAKKKADELRVRKEERKKMLAAKLLEKETAKAKINPYHTIPYKTESQPFKWPQKSVPNLRRTKMYLRPLQGTKSDFCF